MLKHQVNAAQCPCTCPWCKYHVGLNCHWFLKVFIYHYSILQVNDTMQHSLIHPLYRIASEGRSIHYQQLSVFSIWSGCREGHPRVCSDLTDPSNTRTFSWSASRTVEHAGSWKCLNKAQVQQCNIIIEIITRCNVIEIFSSCAAIKELYHFVADNKYQKLTWPNKIDDSPIYSNDSTDLHQWLGPTIAMPQRLSLRYYPWEVSQ